MTDNIFENMANRYDTPERIHLAAVIENEVAKELADSKDKILLDYGCGTGLVSLPLAKYVKRLLLADSSDQMLAVVKQKTTAMKISNAETLAVDFSKEIPKVKADIILLSLVLLHIPETEKILRVLYSALNPQGKLLIVDFDKNARISHPRVHNGFDQQELRELLSETGFEHIKSRTFYQGKKIFMKQDAALFLSVSEKQE